MRRYKLERPRCSYRERGNRARAIPATARNPKRGAARGREGINRDSRSGIRIASLARSSVTVRGGKSNKKPGEAGSDAVLLGPCQKAGRGERRPLFIMSLPRGDKLG